MRPFLALTAIAATALAADFPKPINTGTDVGLKPMTADEAVKQVKMPDGFKATVFAAEPDVQNPIACAWDSRGRLWVAENYSYGEASIGFDKRFRDRILILEDTDNDGRHDKRTVFADGLFNLSSIELGHGGVFATAAPYLLWLPFPSDQSDRTDPTKQKILLDGFDAGGIRHNFVNGLRWGPDGWLYGRHGIMATSRVGKPGTPDAERLPINVGIWRYHPVRGTVEMVTYGGTNPWGLDFNAEGEGFFTNTVTGHLYHMVPGAHYERMYGEDPNPHIYQLLPQTADHYHYDRSQSWTASRDGKANDFGGGHAHVGCMIYLGENWPAQYRGKLFTLNLHGRRINVNRLERQGSGYVGKSEPDMITFGDPWFRGNELTYGPDGGVYVLDWSDQGECHENDGVHRESGRIYKIVYAGSEKGTSPAVSRNEWESRIAWRLLAERESKGNVSNAVGAYWKAFELGKTKDLKRALNEWPNLLNPADAINDDLLSLTYWASFEPLIGAEDNAVSTRAVALAYGTKLRHFLENTARRLTHDFAKKPERLDGLLALANTTFDETKAAAILRGMSAAFRGVAKAKAPASWPAFAAKAATAPALAAQLRDLNVIFGDGRALDEIRALALDAKADIPARKQAVESLVAAKPADLRTTLEKLATDRELMGAALRGMAVFDDAGPFIATNYQRLRPDLRAEVVPAMCSRAAFASALLDAVAAGKIARTDITPYHARQIAALNDAAASKRLAEVWGTVATTSEQKKTRMADLRAALTPEVLAKADIPKGREIYTRTCAACHTLFDLGQTGTNLGPNLTGSGRGDLHYLLENIVDPSALVPADFKLSTITLTDGRVLSGFISAQNDQTLTLRTITGTETHPRASVAKTESSPQSLMPEGLLDALKPEEIRDLFGFLMKK